jgi:hypothetical protein
MKLVLTIIRDFCQRVQLLIKSNTFSAFCSCNFWRFFVTRDSIVFILFVDSVNRSFKTQEKHDRSEEHHHVDSRSDSYLHAKLFQAQRNMYLTGSVIFLSLVLNRFFNMIVELAKNEEKTEVI